MAAGAFGYSVGGPVGAYIGGVVGAEFGSLVAGRTKLDIVLVPLVVINSGGIVSGLTGPYIQEFMVGIGTYIDANGQFDLHKSVASNAAYLNDIVATAADQEVGIAIENGTNMLQEVHPQPQESRSGMFSSISCRVVLSHCSISSSQP